MRGESLSVTSVRFDGFELKTVIPTAMPSAVTVMSSGTGKLVHFRVSENTSALMGLPALAVNSALVSVGGVLSST